MYILGIETSCDETAAAVLKIASKKKSMRFLSNVISSQIKLHSKTGGVVPEVAARAHLEKIVPIIKSALRVAQIGLPKISAIAVTCGPGLAPALMVGVDAAKTLAWVTKKPIVPINHLEAHVFSPFINLKNYSLPAKKNIFPAISLIVSGGHTELVLVKDWLNYKKIGQTLDDAAGECFDKVARLLNLPYPGGPALAELAKKGEPVINFPRPLINEKSYNLSFSGLKTSVLYFLRERNYENLTKNFFADVAASTEKAIVDVLVSKTIKAANNFKAKTILVGGGVAANELLRAEIKKFANKNKKNLLIALPEFCTDNAAMIAFCGWLNLRKNGAQSLDKIRTRPDWDLK